MNTLTTLNSIPVTEEDLSSCAEVFSHLGLDSTDEKLIDFIMQRNGFSNEKACAVAVRMNALAGVLRKCPAMLRQPDVESWLDALFVCAATEPLVQIDDVIVFDQDTLLRRVEKWLSPAARTTING